MVVAHAENREKSSGNSMQCVVRQGGDEGVCSKGGKARENR